MNPIRLSARFPKFEEKALVMKCEYLGDSYDAVKRLWRQLLADVAPLYAEPRFLPECLREDFTRLTEIPIMLPPLPDRFSILNDPDTGIRLPNAVNQRVTRTHTSITAIVEQFQGHCPRCIVTFDQSYYRHPNLTRDKQRQTKLRSLRENGYVGFYYVSHAPFLFAFANNAALKEVRNHLIHAGIPADRFEQSQR
jgi:hypothetical protein